jgi:hypothetical protein
MNNLFEDNKCYKKELIVHAELNGFNNITEINSFINK